MIKTKVAICLAMSFGILGFQSVPAQNQPSSIPPPPVASPTPKLSAILTKNLEEQKEISREQREQAYAKLLEGQRYYWNSSPIRVPNARSSGEAMLAKQAFIKALELNPNLSEGYTALAEIALMSQPSEIEEAVLLANLSIKIFPDNFGARRILARIYTIKSRVGSERIDRFDPVFGQKAIVEWKEVARLDSRNAEAWAFLSILYNKQNKSQEHIEALQKWLSSATPIETRYYRAIMGAQENLSPENAALKLGAALVKANRSSEAVVILSRTIADDPDNIEAIDLLRQAIDGAAGETSNATIEALQQAVFANPENVVLVRLLAQVQSRTGKTDDAIKTLRASIARLTNSDKDSAANLQVSLGDLFIEVNRTEEAIAEYETALKIQGIDKTELITDGEREIATAVFGKIIQSHKSAGHVSEARSAIQRARILLGKDDLFADRQLISLLRENGKNQEALRMVRALRSTMKTDYGLLRLEALILTETGKVEEGVSLIKPLIGKGKTLSAPSLMYDDFTNYIYISSLYNQAKRSKDAISNAQLAFTVAENEEKKQIANLSLANAQQTSGDYKTAEETLRNLLKQTPSNPFALNNLGYFLIEQDRKLDEAVSLIRQAVEIDPTNSSYLDSLGWAYFKMGKLNEAELYLREALSNDSSSATIYEHLGDVYQKQGKTNLARISWQKAINLATGIEVNNRLKDKLASITTK